ncbi:Prominin (Prom) protein [Operophtera brumata]|uniref:Prominin (Prom) protein n=1 Tax=Operophtera brumata TaxID=104452 RepID=A0A0L7KK83_OPEBR|nr:Prominin (Prom) protein [Operophtera brumata]
MLKLVFCVVLCGVVVSTLAEIENKMDQLSQRLREEMADVWDMAAVNYSEPVINTTYKASVEFDMRAMGPLYNSTHMVIDVIANKQAYPEGNLNLK